MGLAVAAIFTVGIIVLLVIRNQVTQGKPVVGGDEVDGRGWATAVVGIKVRRTR